MVDVLGVFAEVDQRGRKEQKAEEEVAEDWGGSPITSFRVSNVVGTTSRDGLREVDRLYPLPVEDGPETPARAEPPTGQPDQTVRAGDDTYGVLLGFFTPWLVGVAHAHGATT